MIRSEKFYRHPILWRVANQLLEAVRRDGDLNVNPKPRPAGLVAWRVAGRLAERIWVPLILILTNCFSRNSFVFTFICVARG
jgi:hypothetical protein